MGQLVFQATAGGQVALVGPNPATNFSINVPAINGTFVTTGDTGTVTNTMLASNVYTAPGTIGSGTPNTGAFTTLSASTSITNASLTSGRVIYTTTGGLETASANMTFNGTSLTLANDASISGLTVGKGAGAIASNTTVGSGALASGSSSGGFNAAFGTNAMAVNTSGGNNSAFGYGAMAANTTGGLNTASGVNALTANTTGGSNTAYGVQALTANTTASNNTAVGYQAGYSNTTGGGNGGQNTFIGDSAGYSTTSDQNTFVGRQSGYYVTSGRKNTVLGMYNGNQGGLDIRTSSNYIVLSDGDGNPRGIFNGSGQYLVNATSPISSGQVGVIAGSSNNGLEVKVTNNGYAPFVGYNSSGSLIFYADGGGTIHAVSTSITAISDQKLKTNIKTIKYGLDTVNQLKPVTFDFIKNDLVNGETGKLGFIAQDVESVIPELVADGLNKSENGTPYKTLNMGDMLPVLVKAVQELNAKVTALEAQLGAK